MMNIQALNSTTILSEEVLTELFDIDSEIDRAHELLELKEKAKGLGVLTKFNELVKAYKSEYKALKKAQEQKQNTRHISTSNVVDYDLNEPETELHCGAWIADMEGVRELTILGEKVVCYQPIYISARMVNTKTHKEKVEIRYYKKSHEGGVWKSVIVDKGMIASASKIVQLADLGIAVNSENAKSLVRFLSDIENLNTEIIPLIESTSKLGWIENTFMPYDNTMMFDAKEQYPELLESIKSHGSETVWFDFIKELRANDRYEINLYLAGAFASVLLKPLNMLPFILNLWGESGAGKTVSIMIACSVWANPGENQYITDPSSTTVALERRNDVLNNFPLIIDDLSKTRDKNADGFTDLIYLLCSGKGKDRSNIKLGLEVSSKWQNVTLTNMERPLAVETMRGGAINRILDFEMMDGDIFTNGHKVVELVSNNYGFAGEQFVELIQEIGIEKVKEIQEEFLERIREKYPDKEEKQKMPLSVILTADKLTADYIFKDGVYLDFDRCAEQLKSVDDVSENKRAYEFILSEVSININNFTNEWDDIRLNGQVWGIFDRYFEEDYVLIYANKFKEICAKGNISAKAFLGWADKNNLLYKHKSNKTGDHGYRKKIRGINSYFYALKMPKEPEMPVFEQLSVDDMPPF